MKFVDTSFRMGLRFRRDARHDDARRIWEAGPGALLTTNLVLGETWTFLNRKAGHDRAVEFARAAERLDTLTVRVVDQDLDHEAWRGLRRHDERRYSYVDATSFALMRKLRIRHALAFGGDFAAAASPRCVPTAADPVGLPSHV